MGILALVLIGFLPGFALSMCVFRDAEELGAGERAMLSVIYSLALTAVVALALAAIPHAPNEPGFLRAGTLWASHAALLASLAAGALYLRIDVRSHLAVLGSALGHPTSLIVLGASALFAALFADLYSELPRRTSPVSWYYLRDVLGVASLGSIPATTIEYTVEMPFEVNKASWYLTIASWSLLSGIDSPFRIEEFWVAATAFLMPLGAWRIAQMFHLKGPPAALATTLICSTPWLLKKLAAFRGECFGLVLALPVAWLAIEALRGRDMRWTFSAGVGLGLIAASHMVPATVTSFLILGWTAALLFETPRDWPRLLRTSATIGVCAAAFVAVSWGAMGRGIFVSQPGLSEPARFESFAGLDPAKAFEHVAYGKLLDTSVRAYRGDEPGLLLPLSEIHMEFLKAIEIPAGFQIRLTPTAFWWITALFFAMPIALLPATRFRESLLAIAFTTALVYAFAVALSWHYDTYLPAAHAVRRDFPYISLFIGLLIAINVAALFEALGRSLSEARLRTVVVLLVASLAIGGASEGYDALSRNWSKKRSMEPDGEAALAWIRDQTRPDEIVLIDGASDGLLRVLTNRASITEGRAPYFEPRSLRFATATLNSAILFFLEPNVDWLHERSVDYVITGSAAFASRPFKNAQSHVDLREVEGLQLAQQLGEVAIYRVLPRL